MLSIVRVKRINFPGRARPLAARNLPSWAHLGRQGRLVFSCTLITTTGDTAISRPDQYDMTVGCQ